MGGLEDGAGVGDQVPAGGDEDGQGLAGVAGEVEAGQDRLALVEEAGQGGLDEGVAGGEVAVDGAASPSWVAAGG